MVVHIKPNLISDGMIVAVVPGAASKDPKFALEEGDGRAMDGVHLWDLLPFVGVASQHLPTIGIGSPEALSSTADNNGP